MFKNIEVTSQLPDISKLDFKAIDKRYLRVLLLNFSIVAIALFVGLYFLITNNLAVHIPEYTPYFYVALALILSLFLLFIVLGFYKRKYAVREQDISYKKGVIVQTITTVPFARIQHVELEEKPFSRLFKLASIKIFTAGESGGDLKINGLSKKEAKKIKEFITHFINE
ncbi:PH domain-containing protein [Lutibacter sp. A64]|uniref:PH domain-containing protein n=1 Tax=Lutibacter sp. A64 TaxID=2918526 RepID=UPI001F06F6D5|nr:PH domain-containing protein [Lutibacter sp. A64]UMB53870.1 PH domain-containing protein [Lutibacter sp. A64]